MFTPLRLLLFASILLTVTLRVSAQTCANGRFTNDVFSSVDKKTGILFGRNSASNYSTTPYSSYPAKDLLLDFYQPSGDPAVKRPLVIFSFGGGFIFGSRTDMDTIATAFAKKGYAVATIDYRLIDTTNKLDLLPLLFGSDADKLKALQDVIVKASSDVRAAIRFFKFDAATVDTFHIDPTKIFLGGVSAGAIASLEAAYVDNINEDPKLTATFLANGGAANGVEGNTEFPNHPLIGTYNSSGVAGVINIAGAVLDTNVIDKNDPPVYSAQGSADEVIPYTSGGFSTVANINGFPIAVNIPVTFFGAKSIDTRAASIGLRHQLFTIVGGNHASPGDPTNAAQILAESSAFLQPLVCGSSAQLPVTLTSFTVGSQNCTAVLAWQTATELQSSRYDLETSTDGAHFSKAASVASKNQSAGAAYSYKIENASAPAWFRLKMVDLDGSFTYSSVQRYTPQCNAVVQVYPNPAQTTATIRNLQAGMYVEVMTTEGRLLWSQKAVSNAMEIPVARFAKGLLLVQVKDENGMLYHSTKLMKN